MITDIEELNRLFKYDDISGGLIRKVSVSNNTKVGDFVGRATSGGYISTTIKGVEHQVHRIVYLIAKGRLPDFIDHKDGDTSNNRMRKSQAMY